MEQYPTTNCDTVCMYDVANEGLSVHSQTGPIHRYFQLIFRHLSTYMGESISQMHVFTYTHHMYKRNKRTDTQKPCSASTPLSWVSNLHMEKCMHAPIPCVPLQRGENGIQDKPYAQCSERRRGNCIKYCASCHAQTTRTLGNGKASRLLQFGNTSTIKTDC